MVLLNQALLLKPTVSSKPSGMAASWGLKLQRGSIPIRNYGSGSGSSPIVVDNNVAVTLPARLPALSSEESISGSDIDSDTDSDVDLGIQIIQPLFHSKGKGKAKVEPAAKKQKNEVSPNSLTFY